MSTLPAAEVFGPLDVAMLTGALFNRCRFLIELPGKTVAAWVGMLLYRFSRALQLALTKGAWQVNTWRCNTKLFLMKTFLCVCSLLSLLLCWETPTFIFCMSPLCVGVGVALRTRWKYSKELKIIFFQSKCCCHSHRCGFFYWEVHLCNTAGEASCSQSVNYIFQKKRIKLILASNQCQY